MIRRGPQPERRSWTEEVCDRLAHYYSVEGLFFDEIAQLLGKTPYAVRVHVRLLGLTLTPQAIAARKARGVYRGGKHRQRRGLT